jgi:hypothetical protein
VAINRLLRTNGSFEPEAIRTMHSAYEAICEHFGLRNQKNDRVTEIGESIGLVLRHDLLAMRKSPA